LDVIIQRSPPNIDWKAWSVRHNNNICLAEQGFQSLFLHFYISLYSLVEKMMMVKCLIGNKKVGFFQPTFFIMVF
jgi:hypothetical protein